MLRILTLIYLFIFSCLGSANQPASLYQVDLIIFAHRSTTSDHGEDTVSPLLPPNLQHAISLQSTSSGAITPYCLLPTASSHLRNEYWALNHKPNYQILAHYTWLQPSHNQQSVALPPVHSGGWNVEGTLRIRQSNYYLLDTDLLFSAPGNGQTAFLFSQKQRLKPGTVYYLDHPQAGMLIKIQHVA